MSVIKVKLSGDEKKWQAKKMRKLKKKFNERLHTLQRISFPTHQNFNSLLSGYWNLLKLRDDFFSDFNGIAIKWLQLTRILQEKCISQECISIFHYNFPSLSQCFASLVAKNKVTLKFLESGFKTWLFVLANIPEEILKSTATENVYAMSQIAEKILSSGHYPSQMNALRVLLKYLDFDAENRNDIMESILSSDKWESARSMLKYFDYGNFDIESRKFLNHCNKRGPDATRILSVKVLYGFMEQILIKKPIVEGKTLELWADFNTASQTVSISCICTRFGENESHYLVMIEAQIEDIKFNEYAKQMTIRVKNAPKCDHCEFETYLKDVTAISLYVDKNTSCDEFCQFTTKMEIYIENDAESVATVLDTITDRGNISTSAFSLTSTPIKNFKNISKYIQNSNEILPTGYYIPPPRASLTDNLKETNANEVIDENCLMSCQPTNNIHEDSDLFRNSNFSSDIQPTQKFGVKQVASDSSNFSPNYFTNSDEDSLKPKQRSLNKENDPIVNSAEKDIHKSQKCSNKTVKLDNKGTSHSKLKQRQILSDIQIPSNENLKKEDIPQNTTRSCTKRKLYDSPHHNMYLSAGSQDTTIQRRRYLDKKRKLEAQQKNDTKNLLPIIDAKKSPHSFFPMDEDPIATPLKENSFGNKRFSTFSQHENANIKKNINKINSTAGSSGRKFFASQTTAPYDAPNTVYSEKSKETKKTEKFTYKPKLKTEIKPSENFTKPSAVRKSRNSENEQKIKHEPSIPSRTRLERAKKPKYFKFSDSENESDGSKKHNQKQKKEPNSKQPSSYRVKTSTIGIESNNSKYVNLSDEKSQFKIPDQNVVTSQRRIVNYEIESTISENIDGKYRTREIFTKTSVTEIEKTALNGVPEEPKWLINKYFNSLASEKQSSENLYQDIDSNSNCSRNDNSMTSINNENEAKNENNEKVLNMEVSPISLEFENPHKTGSAENISEIDVELVSHTDSAIKKLETGLNTSNSTFVVPIAPQKRKLEENTHSNAKKLKKDKKNGTNVNNTSDCLNETTNTDNEDRLFNTISAMYQMRMENIGNEICNDIEIKYDINKIANQAVKLMEEYITSQERYEEITEPLLAKIDKLTKELNDERKALYETMRESYLGSSKMQKDFGKIMKILDKNKASAYNCFHKYMEDINDDSMCIMENLWNNHLDNAAQTINNILKENLNF